MNRGRAPFLVFLTGLLGVAGLSTSSVPQRTGPQVVPPDQRLQGMSYAQWNARWNQWFLSLPLVPGHPGLDDPAFDVTLGQTGNVWFLAAPLSATAVQRAISIPAGTYLFVALLAVEASSLESGDFHGCSDADQRAIADFYADCMVPYLEIDGVPLRHVGRHRVASPQHQIFLPYPNYVFVPAGTVAPCSPPLPPMVGTSVSDGYWAMIRPLARGRHRIHFGGDICGYFEIDMTYDVTVY